MIGAFYPDRSTRLVLTTSLALNRCLTAFIVMQQVGPYRQGEPSAAPAAREATSSIAAFERLMRALPSGDAGILRMGFASRRDALIAGQRNYAAALEAARAEIARTPVGPSSCARP